MGRAAKHCNHICRVVIRAPVWRQKARDSRQVIAGGDEAFFKMAILTYLGLADIRQQ
jgi:hypothetical protein